MDLLRGLLVLQHLPIHQVIGIPGGCHTFNRTLYGYHPDKYRLHFALNPEHPSIGLKFPEQAIDDEHHFLPLVPSFSDQYDYTYDLDD